MRITMGVFLFPVDISSPPPLDLTLSLKLPNSNSYARNTNMDSSNNIDHLSLKKRDFGQVVSAQDQQNEEKKKKMKVGNFTNSIVQEQDVDLTLSLKLPNSDFYVPENTMELIHQQNKSSNLTNSATKETVQEKEVDLSLFRKLPNSNSSVSRNNMQSNSMDISNPHNLDLTISLKLGNSEDSSVSRNSMQLIHHSSNNVNSREHIDDVEISNPQNLDLTLSLKLPGSNSAAIPTNNMLHPVFLFHKKLTISDLEKDLNRLLIPRIGKHRILKFLKGNHVNKLLNKETAKDGISAFTVDQEGTEYWNMCLKHWFSMKGFVLGGDSLKDFYKNNKLVKGDDVQAWGYYQGDDFRLVLTARNNSPG